MRPEARIRRRAGAAGFTLIELIVVIVVGTVMATTLVVFFRPAIDTYAAARTRAELADQADTAMRRMVRDVRSAVPNSIRTPNANCFELIPTSTGGRYRLEADPANASAPLDTSAATTAFDVLSPMSATPSVGDWVVVGNQSPADVYGGVGIAAVTSVTTPSSTVGRARIGVTSTQFPTGYDGGRFTVVPNAQKAVFYVCSGADGTLDAAGNGRGTLYRLMNYGFNAAYPGACPSTTGADVLATHVRSCSFVYDAQHGATQQSGFVWMQLGLAVGGENAHLAMGAHVDNAP